MSGRDPLAHYLDSGRPAGPWSLEVIQPGQNVVPQKSLRVALHLHLYYPDMAEEIVERLRRTRGRMDLLISVPDSAAAQKAHAIFHGYPHGKIDVEIFNNRGRDIGPFLTGLGEKLLNCYDIVGHLHTKKSHHPGISADSSTEVWRRFLYDNLLGDNMADAMVHRFAADDFLGLVFPDDPNIIGWGENRSYALNLANRLELAESLPETTFNFPVGNMFWARITALKPLFELGLAWEDYPTEPVPYDGSFLHAIERMLPAVVHKAGFRSAVTYVAGVTR